MHKVLATAGFVIALAALVISLFRAPSYHEEGTSFPSSKTETAYERVIRTKTLRCGYVSIPLVVMKDPATGQFSGVSYDVVNALGRFLGIKIDWAVETTFATVLEDLSLGKVDAICHGDFPKSNTVEHALYTEPFHYLGFAAYARSDDDRFTGTLNAINAPGIKIAVQDGEVSSTIARTQLSEAQHYSVPQNASISDMLQAVTTKKADIAIVPVPVAKLFLKNNPGMIRNAYADKPLRVYPISLFVNLDETRLVDFLNKGIHEVILNGAVDTALKKYFDPDDMFFAVSKPYQTFEKVE